MSADGRRPWWQFSLRNFLFAVLIIGPIVGVAGPIVLESITAWKPPPRATRPQPKARSQSPSRERDGYYESGETPLY